MKYVFAFAFAGLMVNSVYAQQVVEVRVPVLSIPDEVRDIPGVNIDLAGVKTGLSPEAIRRRLTENGYQLTEEKTVEAEKDVLNVSNVKVILRGDVSYVSSQAFRKETDELRDELIVDYSSKYAGNKAIKVTRYINYNAGINVSRDAVLNSLKERYGDPSSITKADYCWNWSVDSGKSKTAGCSFRAAEQSLVLSLPRGEGKTIDTFIMFYSDFVKSAENDTLTEAAKTSLKGAIARGVEDAKIRNATLPKL